MIMFEVSYSNQADKFLKKAEKIIAKRIMQKIEELTRAPVIHDTKSIQGSKGLFRVRVGVYRILYEVDYKNNLIGIVKIDKRPKVYQ
ncbi:MAG: type II toxin-antitoxin system RelE/ParE family toxin [Candidatus Aenigmarchaeota archaeon]|nr:type II toxin-antitoxin system RelE/ParE family toxin [Candidatus Aenigmarchaeota archaeon]